MSMTATPITRTARTARTARTVRVHSAHIRPSRATNLRSRQVVLTARGRGVAFLVSVLTLAAVVVGAGQLVNATTDLGGAEPSSVVVGAGDTLWAIAQDIAPHRDPRSVVQQIRTLNDLGTRPIVPGQSILVPITG